MGAPQSLCERLDPRVRRTRQMLFEALERLLAAKGFEELTVTDIADAAGLNRATFYDHYSDKFALLEGLVEARFQELMSGRGLVFDGTCAMALKGIIQATCDYVEGMRGMDSKHFDPAVISVVRRSILNGLREHGGSRGIAPELTAAVASGAIYSGAREWMRTTDRAPASQTVNAIFQLVSPILNIG